MYFGNGIMTADESAAFAKVAETTLASFTRQRETTEAPPSEGPLWDDLAAFLEGQPRTDWPLLIGAIASSFNPRDIKPQGAPRLKAEAA